MEYITHHRYKAEGACGERMNIPYGTTFNTIGKFIATEDGKAICYTTSENAHLHFARNDDGRGLERGALTYAIAYGQRRTPSGFRFTEEEIDILERDWRHFLRDDVDVILFNHDFFEADVAELERLAAAINIKVRR